MLTPAQIAALDRLRACATIAELVGLAAAEAPAATGFARAVLAPLRDGRPVPPPSPLVDAGSEALREAILALPAAPEGDEPPAVPSGPAGLDQETAQALGLRAWVACAVPPVGPALALLVVDRDGPPTDAADRQATESFAAAVGMALERVALRARARTLADEAGRFADVVQDLARDAFEAATALPSDHGMGTALPRSTALRSDDPRYERLSAREKRIVGLLVAGRSNREIAETLLVSPETVKTHVTRILRKLGAANRTEVVALLAAPPA